MRTPLGIRLPVVVADEAHDLAAGARAIGEARGALARGDEVVEHLFAVSSGLESVVIGEDEISGQVRRALEAARGLGLVLEHITEEDTFHYVM